MTPIRMLTPDLGHPTNPDRDAQQRKELEEARQRYEEALARKPIVEAVLGRLETEWIPQLDRDIGEAEEAIRGAEWAFYENRVREQGGQALADPLTGRPMIAIDRGELQVDPAYLAAAQHATRLKEGRGRLYAQRDQARTELTALASGPPHRPGRR
jgi:hypothetical protein